MSLSDPVLEAFKKLPPAVAATLDEVELKALSFSAEFAAVGEEAGTGWANNLKAHIDMGETFDQALAAANQAATDILAPFIAEHPEAAHMIQPLIDALQTGTPASGKASPRIIGRYARTISRRSPRYARPMEYDDRSIRPVYEDRSRGSH